MKTSLPILSIILAMFTQSAYAKVDSNSPLFLTMKKMDATLFEQGFNQCDLISLDKIIHRNLDFYHDVGGMQNKSQFMAAIKNNICSTPQRKPIRKLVNGSLELYQLNKNGSLYGVIQKGEHEFHIKEPNKALYITGIAKFTHTWILEDEHWQLIESLSYEHRPAAHSSVKLPPEQDKKFNAHFKEPLFNKDNRIISLLNQHNIPSLGIGYINNGELQQVRLFGNKKMTADRVNKPITKNALYKVASLTKPITALVALKLVNSNKWQLDKPIKDYYEDPILAGSPELALLTTRHILSHQTGLPNWRHLTNDKKLKFEFMPGTKFQYSGEGFEYLRKALEGTFAKDLDALANELIFEPLNMNSTHFYWKDSIDESSYATEHDENGVAIDLIKHSDANAAANLLTTIEDYGKFMVHILNGAGLKKQLYQDMLSNQLKQDDTTEFGLGWKIFSDLADGEYAIQHTGGDYGLKSIAFLLPKSKRGLVIFTNSENGMVVWSKIIEEYFSAVGKSLINANLK
jgi:CubicO group peptidase (beta-lactamase class C family)